MNKRYSLTITNPSKDYPLIEYQRDFDVEGIIHHNGTVPDDCILEVYLYDKDNQIVRRVLQNKKNNRNVFLNHPDLITYKEDLDPDYENLLEYGFPELLVKDLDNPYDSLSDATIKCFYSDDVFRCVIVSGSDVKHGRVFESGMNYHDENGKPYSCLEMGRYKIVVRLKDVEGSLLAECEKDIEIGRRENQTIVRFNPLEHRKKMIDWCMQNGFSINVDCFPGYLMPYLGKWYYHMGLLKYYRSNDIALYVENKVHMFIYMIDSSSTSYETEFAYLSTQEVIDDEDRFIVYYYDIGEAIIGKDRQFEARGSIRQFDLRQMVVYRVDVVSEACEENIYDLSERNLEYSICDLDDICIKAGSTIGIAGAIRPCQLDKNDFILKDDNTYKIRNSISKVIYDINDGNSVVHEERKMSLKRIYNDRIEDSVFEFYNIFKIDEEYRDKTLNMTIHCEDDKGVSHHDEVCISIKVI